MSFRKIGNAKLLQSSLFILQIHEQVSISKKGKALFVQSFCSKKHLHSHVRSSKVGNLGSGHPVILQTHWHDVGSKIGSAGSIAMQSASELRSHSHSQISGLKIGLSYVQDC